MWIAPSVPAHGDTAVARFARVQRVARFRNGCSIRFQIGASRPRARPRRPSIAERSARGMRVILMGSGRDHSTHIYYVIILIA